MDIDQILQTAKKYSHEVDRDCRFPHETIQLAKDLKLLSLADSGDSNVIRALVEVVRTVASKCGSTGLILAMHYTMLRVARTNPVLMEKIRDITPDGQALIASSTTENKKAYLGESKCFIEHHGDLIEFTKDGAVISYAEHADAILCVASERDLNGKPQQVLVGALREETSLSIEEHWNGLGMRGTESHTYRIDVRCPADRKFSRPYMLLSSLEVLPCSYTLWTAAWTGILEGLVMGNRSRKKKRGASVRDSQISKALTEVVSLRAFLELGCSLYASSGLAWAKGERPSPSRTVTLNYLKIGASEAANRAATAMRAHSGMAAYTAPPSDGNSAPIRDLMSAPIMIGNDGLAELSIDIFRLFGIENHR